MFAVDCAGGGVELASQPPARAIIDNKRHGFAASLYMRANVEAVHGSVNAAMEG